MENHALARAIDIAGGQKPLAERIGTSQQQVSYWLRRARKSPPAEYVIPIEQATEGQVTREELRPDLYPSNSAPG